MELKLGIEAIDLISGLSGIITAKSMELNGSIQYCIRPNTLDDKGKRIDSEWIDSQSIKYVGIGILDDINISEPSTTDIILGSVVKHFNNFEGIAIEKLEYMNGCVYFNVLPNTEYTNKMPDKQFIACQYLSIIKDKSSVLIEEDDNGGPPSSAPTM